jgi:ABC-type phosphate transport system substrate-binding protein
VKATQRQHYPDEVTQKQLQQTWQTLGLSEGDVEAIERRINAEIATHQANLRQYEQEFTEGVQQEYPLSAFKRSQLTQRHQALNLTAEDVTAIENPIVVAIEEHRQKLQQYEEVFRESIQFEYPLSDVTREELQRFQRILELNDAETLAIEAIIIQSSSLEEEVSQVQQKILTQLRPLEEISSQSLTTEINLVQEAQQHGKLEESTALKSLEVTPPLVPPQASNLLPLPDSKATKKGLRKNLVWLGILPFLLLGSGIWYFLLDKRTDSPNTDSPDKYIQWFGLVRNFSEVFNVPSGQFTYTGEEDSTWSYVLTQPVDNNRLGDLLSKPKPDAGAIFNYESVLSSNVSNPIKSIEEVKTRKKDFAITSLVNNLTSKLAKQPVAYDGLIVFVPFNKTASNLANALGGQISLEQLRQIYTGRITNWQQINPKLPNLTVKPFVPSEPEAIIKFQEIVLKNDAQDKALFESTVKIDTAQTQKQIRSEFLEGRGIGIISFGIISKTWKQCTGYSLAIADGKKSAIQPLFEKRDRRSINPSDDLCQHDDYYVDVPTFQSYPLGYPIFVVYPQDNNRLSGGSTFAEMLTTRQGQCLLSKIGLVALQPMPDDINSYACKSIP